jgi:hypothetical protein
MVNESNLGKTIRLKPDTIKRIEKLRPRGQSYDGFIATILDIFEKSIGKTEKR